VAGGKPFAQHTHHLRPELLHPTTVTTPLRPPLHRLSLRPGMLVNSVRRSVAIQLPANRRRGSIQITGDLVLTVSGLSHDLNGMALFRRQLPVGFLIHIGFFGLAGANLQAVGAAFSLCASVALHSAVCLFHARLK